MLNICLSNADRCVIGNAMIPTGSPRLLSLQLLGKGIEGSTLHVEKRYWGGEEGNSVYRWFLVRDSILVG